MHCLCGYNSSGDYDLLASIQDSVNERLILYIRKVYNVSINYYEEGNKGVTGKRKFKQVEWVSIGELKNTSENEERKGEKIWGGW